MKVTVISASDHGESERVSCNIVDGVLSGNKNFADLWLLPAGITTFCTDCGYCFAGEPNKCRHAREVIPILKSMLTADTVIFVTPSVSGHAPAVMVNFLNYLAYIQLGHSPIAEMYSKRFVILSLGDKRAAEDIADNVRLWGASDVHVLANASGRETERLLTAPHKKPGFFARWQLKRRAKKAGITLPPELLR